MVIVQFRGRLVQQYRACVVDSLGLGITCSSSCLIHTCERGCFFEEIRCLLNFH